jgi:hypothetical protein
MVSFSRSMLVGVEKMSDERVVLHGILEDNLYAMEVDVEVTRPGYEIVAISGRMKRYTTSQCPRATGVLKEAVGMKLNDPGLASRINKEIGRQGCRHYAELILECLDTFVAAEPATARKALQGSGIEMAEEAFREHWAGRCSLSRDRCRAYREQTPGK